MPGHGGLPPAPARDKAVDYTTFSHLILSLTQVSPLGWNYFVEVSFIPSKRRWRLSPRGYRRGGLECSPTTSVHSVVIARTPSTAHLRIGGATYGCFPSSCSSRPVLSITLIGTAVYCSGGSRVSASEWCNHSFRTGEFGRLLEVGYGSGVFLPELALHARELYALDIHERQHQVTRALAKHGVQARLYSAMAENMPFPDDQFDTVVGVSCLEFIADLGAAAREVTRVLAPNGVFIAVSPSTSRLIDAGFRLLTGKNPEDDFQGRRQRVLPTLLRYFAVEQRTVWPSGPMPLYSCLRLRPRRESSHACNSAKAAE